MLDLDQRVVEGLHELAGRAPAIDVWPATEKHVAKRRRARRSIGGCAIAVVLLVGGLVAVGLVRSEPSRGKVAGSGPSGAVGTGLPDEGPIDGALPVITAAPGGVLSFAPARISVRTGVYSLVLRGGSNAPHSLAFDDPSTLWSPVNVTAYGETNGGRIFFDRPGDYTFYCAVPGHRAAGMHGVVHVTGTPVTLEQAEASATGSA